MQPKEEFACEVCGGKALHYVQDYSEGVVEEGGKLFRSTKPSGPRHYLCQNHTRSPRVVKEEVEVVNG